MSSIQAFIESVRGKGRSVVLPEGDDERVMRAARRLVDEDIAVPIVLGDEAAFKANGIASDGIRVIDPATSEDAERYARVLQEGPRAMDESMAQRQARKRLYFGALMTRAGDADTFVAGAVYATARVIGAGLRCVGLADGINTASSFFLMEVPPAGDDGVARTLLYADCAVVINPTAEQLADITVSSANSARYLLGEEPRIAMLSFSTHGSAKHADADKVIAARDIVRMREPTLAVEGEMQVDSALVKSVADRKMGSDNPVAGNANVLVFPDLDAGNIAYKLTQYLAGAKAIGPVLQGFSKPISDLSRGASVDDIVGVTAVCLAQIDD